MNVLYLVPYVPSLIRVRPYHFIRGLLQRGHRVTVLSLWSNEVERNELEQLAILTASTVGESLSKLRSYWNVVQALLTSEPLQAVYCWQPALAEKLQQMREDFDIVHVEHLRGARYGLGLTNGTQTCVPFVWDSVDCISELFEQASTNGASAISRLITRFDLPRTKRYEGQLLDAFDRVVVTSAHDAAALRRLNTNGAEISVIPNGVDLDYFTPNTSGTRRHSAIVMTGKMSYHANVAMAHRFVEQVLPRIWAERPEAQLWIVGKDPPRAVRELGRHKQVQVTGTVPDIRPFLRSATLAVAPAPYAVGIQNKVLEAMACETPVVASPQAASGLSANHGRELLIADDPEDFSTAVLSLLGDPGIRRSLGRAGRRYVERHHRWSNSVMKLEGIYDELIDAAS